MRADGVGDVHVRADSWAKDSGAACGRRSRDVM